MGNPITFDIDELDKKLREKHQTPAFDIDELSRKLNETTQFSTGIEPTKVENPYPTFSEKLSGSMLGTTPKDIASTLPQRKAMQDVEEGQKRAFETKFTTDPEYRANWFQENTGMSEEDFKAASAKVFAERFDNLLPRAENIFKKNIEDNAKQRGGTGIIRTIENLSSSMGAKSKLDELRGLSASFKNNNVWSGMYEGADLLDVMSGGLADFASEKAYHEALKKQANGEELSEEEQFAIDASDLYDDINETFELLGGRSGWNKAGKAVGQSAEFSAGMLPTSGLGFATGLMKNVGLKAGWKAVKDAANNGVRAALSESLKQGGKVIGRSLYNTGLTYAESIPRAVFMPSTYGRYWELRNERLKNGESLEGNWLQDAGRAGIEMTHELASEIWGSTIIHDSFRAMGKALGVDKAMDAIGFGRRKRTIFGWTPTAAQREAMRNLGYSGDWFSEVASEAAGDVATNLAMGVFFDDAKWGDMATKEYWTTLLGATAMQGIAFTSANMLTNIPEYHRLNNSQKKRDNALSNIKSEDLRKAVEIALTHDSAEDMGTALSQIDWNAYDKVDVANAMDAVRLEVPLRIATSEREESERIAKFAPLLEATMAQAYQGADAANPAPQPIYVEAKTEDGASVRIVSGDYTNPDAMLNVEDISTGETFPIIASKVSDVKELSLENKIAESYKLMFSTEENVQRLSKVMESLGRLAYYGKVTSADAEDIIKRAGYVVFSEGQIATLVNGEQVEIASPIMADGHYLVRDNNGNTSIVSLLDIVQPNVEVAEAQIKMASREEQGTTAEATSAMGQSMNASMPQSPMPEGVTAGEVWVTPQGIGRVLEYNPETGKVYVDINLSSDTLNKEEDEELVEVDAAELTRKPSEAEMAEARARSVRRNALRIVDETSDAVGAIQEVEAVAQPVEQAAEVIEQAPQEVPSMENVPTTADGAVDYESITDANLYAKLLTQDLGSKDEALEVVNTSIEAYEAEIADMQSKKEKSTTKAVAKNKQIKAMQQQLDVLNQVRDILTPQEMQETPMTEVEQIAEAPQVEEIQQEPIGLVQDDFTATLPNGEAELIDSLARSLGLSVEFVDKVNKGNSNAQILGNKVLIAKKNRDKAIKFLVGHEFTHRMQDLSPEAYAEFKAAVKEYMGEEVYNTLLQKEIAKYREHNIYRTQEQLEDEIIADFAGSLAFETDVLDTFIAAHADKKSMWQAILDVLRAIREWILKDTAYDTAEARALQNTIGKLETLLQSASEKVAEGATEEVQYSDAQYSLKETDPATLEALNNGEKIKVYRGMQVIDGKLYPPMSAKVDGKMREPIELGVWERAEERPDLADAKGYFKLDKGNKTSLKARYNPYIHTSLTPLNDQFSSAQDRPNLVTVEVEIPASELTSGYKADKAKDAVGKVEWKAGVVQSQLSGTRTVILSRWDRPLRIVPDSEVAQRIVEMFGDKKVVMPSNVVTPSLRAELEKLGVPFKETDNQGKERYYLKDLDAPYLEAVERGDMATAERMVREAAAIAMPNTKVIDKDGLPKVVYHGTSSNDTFNVFDLEDSGMIFMTSSKGIADQYTHKRGSISINPKQTGRIMPLFANIETPLVVDANKRLWRNLRVDWSEAPVSTRDIALYAKENGYDGVIIKRVRDNMFDDDTRYSDVYIAFNPSQVKSAGALYSKTKRSHFPWDEYEKLEGEIGITYDDAGNIIPLSERFNPEKEDIRYSLKDEATEKIFATAKTKFGTTYDMREAGWILPDGSMLDFSGKHEVRGADTSFLNGRRSVDHRAISEIAYDFDENETGVETDLGDFLDRGAIRIDYNVGSINLNVAPTKAQKDRLRRLIERNDGDVYIDFGKGWDTEHYVEYESARPTRVLGDIDRYFNEGIKPTGNVRFSLKDEDTAVTTSDGNMVAETNEATGQGRFSLKTYREGGRETLANFLNARVKDNAITPQEAEEMLRDLDDIYNICETMKDDYAPFGAWSEAKVVEDKDGNPVFSVIKANGEYVMNLDFSLVCKKRRTLDAVLNKMIAEGMIENLPDDNTVIAKINAVIRKYGFETACALCFVDARRFQIVKVANNFCDMYNGLVDLLIPKKSDIKVNKFNYAGHPNTPFEENALETMADDAINLEALRKIGYKQVKNKKGEMTQDNSVLAKMARHLVEHPEDRKHLLPSDFLSTAGFDQIKTNKPEILKLYNAKKGTGGPKAAFSDVQYLNDIIHKNWSPEAAFAVGGVRVQSFSDYVPRMVFDYIQMMAELAAKKLPAHAYTKEPLFAKTFGLTGMKINLSLVPDVVADGVAAGLDADGNYVWKEGETFPYEEAVAVQNADGYKANCGTIAVGVSDAHIWKMLDDANIRMIIPYHKSGLPKQVAKMNNVAAFTDYTKVQNTRKGNRALTKEEAAKVPNYNELVQKHNDPRKAAQAYLDWCKEMGYTPKFSKFAEHPNYYKLLEDFTTMVDDVYAPQGVVTFTFPNEADAFGSLSSLIKQGLEEDAVLEGERDAKVGDIVEEVGEVLGIRYSLIGEQGAANLDKAEEATIRLDNLSIARDMEASGKDAKTIKMATGWERGADGLWRYEVDDDIPADSIARLREARQNPQGGGIWLNNLLGENHPIVKAYRKAKYIYVWLNNLPEGVAGEFNPKSGHISLRMQDDVTDEQRIRTLAHEIQHFIQSEEGFAQGGSPYTETLPTKEQKARLDAIKEVYEKFFVGDMEMPARKAIELYPDRWGSLSEDAKAIIEDEIKYNQYVSLSGIEARLLYSGHRGEALGVDRYKRLAGEVEARNASRRMNMSMGDRLASLAEETEDVAREDQIILRNGYMEGRYSLKDTFYSNAENAVRLIKQEKATPEQWLKMIEKNGGLKAGEDKWLGLSDWLKASDKKTLTKDEVLDYIHQNQIQIEEVEYEEYAEEAVEEQYRAMEDKLQEMFNNYITEYYEENSDSDEYGDYATDYAIVKLREELGDTFPYTIEISGNSPYFTFSNEDDTEMRKWSEKLGLPYTPSNQINFTRLGYTTDGLDNKREIALTVPTIEPWNTNDEIHFGDAGKGRAVAWIRFGETWAYVKEYADFYEFAEKMQKKYFPARSSYSLNEKELQVLTPEERTEYGRLKNIKANIPMREARNVRVLVIDEIQSKRHQEGREKGYKTIEDEELRNAQGAEIWAMMQKYNVARPADLRSAVSAEDAARLDEFARHKFGEVPSAPFEKNWAELAMKRMLRYAAENGYDKVAWTTGDQQAKRYSIGGVISKIGKNESNNIDEQNFEVGLAGAESMLYLTTDNDGKIIHSLASEYVGRTLSEVFGKELAVKMLNAKENTAIEGEGLRIGGEGMRAFYDQMLPSFVRKYAKKWGATVGEVTMPSLEENNTMHSVDVTPAMRESVMQGQPLFHLKDNVEEAQDVRMTPAEIRAHMFENITRHHEREVNRINRLYDAERRKAERISKQQRMQNGEYPRNAKYTVRLQFLMPQGKTAYPLEWQVVHDIANGLKVKWSDSKDGKKRGLSTELGLGSSRREKYGAITTGAQMYVEDYVAQLVEENDGYARGIDDNDVRSIVLDALSQYTRPKEALDALEQQFLVIEEDAKLQESIDYIERARAKALQEEDEKYEAQKASYEKNPRKFERDYFSRMEKDLRWLNFKEREIRVMREKIQRIRADYRSGREVRNQYLAEVKADIEKFLNNMYGRNISTSEVRFIMNALKKATSVENVTYILNRIATMDYYGTQRIEQERKARLLKMKLSFFIPAENQSLEQYLEQEKISRADAAAFVSRFEEGNVGDDMTVFRAAFKDRYKGVDSKGVTVAKLIDAETAEIMAFISKHAYDKVDLESIESATEKLYEEAERLKNSLPFSQNAMEKIDQAREIIISYWSATAEREELKKSKEDLNDVEARITEAWKNGDHDLVSQLRGEKDAILKDRSSRMPSINSHLVEANDAVERLLLNGKRLLSEEREAQRQHEIEVLNDVVNDITNFGEDYNELMAKANDHRKQTSEERKSKRKMVIHEWTDSLNHLLTLLAPYADGGRGLTYTRFMTAINKAVADTCDNVDIVNAQIAEAVDAIFGKQFQYKNLAQIMRRASAISLAEDVTLGYKAVGKERIPRKWHLRMDNALYLLAMWGQAEGRIKLEANGVTEADIAMVEDLIIKKDRRYLGFMNWVIRELLPSRREGRYNEVFRKVTGRWMPYVENYFPIHILSNSRHTEEKVSEAAGDKKSISPSAIKARIYNTNMIDLNVGFFEALMDNLTTMETWASMAEIEKDMNAILSNNRTKDLMNARLGENFSDRLKTAMQVTLGTLTSGKLGVTERWALNASRLWGATKIGYRINTALKQLSGAGALFAYTGNPIFIGYVLKNLAPTDAAEMFPILEKRWKEGLLGNAGLMDLSRGGDLHVKDWLDRSSEVYGNVTSTITKLGMYPNKIVDFYVSAVFAKSVYQFELNRYKKMGYSEEQAKEKALMDAEDSYNKTQQSSEMAYLSSGQINPNIVYRGLNVFMNNSIANYRLGLSGFEDVARAFSRFSKAQRYYRKEAEKRLYEKYIAEGKSEEEAMKMAKEESQDYKGTSRMGYFARGILKTVWGWWGSNFLFNYLSILPYMWFGDDDEKKREMTSDLWWSALFSPIALIPWGKILYDSVVVAYNNYNDRSIASSVLPMLEGVEDLIEDVVDIHRALREDDDLSNAQIYNTFNTLSTMMVGVDMNTFVNIGDGIADIANGDWMEGTLDILNVPNSQVKLLVGDRKADESWEEYMTRILRVRSLLDKNKVEAAEAAKYNPTTQKWEPEPSITEAQKRDITKMYKQYENAYQQDVLKKHRPNMEWSDTEKRYEEVVKEIGWSPNENPGNKEPKVEISTEVLNTLRYLQGHNAAMNKLKARFVGSDEEYAKYLDTIYQDRKQLIQLYDDNVK